MTPSELKENPAIVADWPKVSRPIDEYLTAHLIETCAGSEGNEEHAQAEIGAARAIANIIKTLRGLSVRPTERKAITIKPLHRFSKTPEPTPET